MTDSEFIILSFINDGLNYSYIIEKNIEKRRLRDYFDLSFSSIYFLIKELENKKYVESYHSFGKKGVTKKCLKITESGKVALKTAFDEKFNAKPILSYPIDYVFLNCHNSNSSSIKNGISKYIKEAERIYLFYLQRKEEIDANHESQIGEKILINHLISRIKNELEWAKNTKNILQNMNNFDAIIENEKEKLEEFYRKIFLDE